MQSTRRMELTLIILLIIASLGIIASLASGNIELRWTGKAVTSDIEYSDVLGVDEVTRDIINDRYFSSNKEFSACLDIKPTYIYSADNARLQTEFHINGMSNITESEGDNYVKQSYCKNGIIHSHPEENCFFSLADLYAIKDRFDHGELFSVIICGKDDMIFITRNDLKERKIRI